MNNIYFADLFSASESSSCYNCEDVVHDGFCCSLFPEPEGMSEEDSEEASEE